MIYTNYESKPAGYAGQVARGDQSLSRAWARTNLEATALIPSGVFVSRSVPVGSADAFGVKLLASATDKIAGIVVTTGVFHNVKPQDQASVMHIGHGDSVWAHMDADNPLEAGDDVLITIASGKEGYIASNGAISTPYYVVRVSGDLAEIARDEVYTPVAPVSGE